MCSAALQCHNAGDLRYADRAVPREESPMLARLISAAVLLLSSIAYATAADLSIAVGADVTSIDPHYHNLTPNNNIAEHIFETLVTKDPKSLLKPALAVSWKAIDDLTWEFK
jgi:peptide/nickel transport system substrate-binding protein